MSNDSKDNKVKIWVALIGFIGVLIAALIGNWDKLMLNNTPSKSSKENITIQDIRGNNSNIINNNSGEVNVNN